MPRVLSPRLILAPEPLIFPRTVMVSGKERTVWNGPSTPERSTQGIIEWRDWDRPHEQLLVAQWIGPSSFGGKPAGLWALYHLTDEPFAPNPFYDGIVDALLACGAILKTWALTPDADGQVALPDVDAEAAKSAEAAAATTALAADWEAKHPAGQIVSTPGNEEGEAVPPAPQPVGARKLMVAIAGLDAAVKIANERPKPVIIERPVEGKALTKAFPDPPKASVAKESASVPKVPVKAPEAIVGAVASKPVPVTTAKTEAGVGKSTPRAKDPEPVRAKGQTKGKTKNR